MGLKLSIILELSFICYIGFNMSRRTIALIALVTLCAANPVKRENLEHDDPIGFNVGKSTLTTNNLWTEFLLKSNFFQKRS